jgi:hypothetical protein
MATSPRGPNAEEQLELQRLGFRGLDIRLPALGRYMSEVNSGQEMHPITSYLESKIRSHSPKRVCVCLGEELVVGEWANLTCSKNAVLWPGCGDVCSCPMPSAHTTLDPEPAAINL